MRTCTVSLTLRLIACANLQYNTPVLKFLFVDENTDEKRSDVLIPPLRYSMCCIVPDRHVVHCTGRRRRMGDSFR
jgi:hypothetical protein